MASRAILRRKTFISDYTRLAPNRPIRILDNVIEPRVHIATRIRVSFLGLSATLEQCNGRGHFVPLTTGMRSMCTAAGEENGKFVRKKKENASSEECDRAILSLSDAKVRAKAMKKLRERKLFYESVRLRDSAGFLRTGPTLKATISMSKIEFAKFLEETASEMAKEVQISRVGEVKRAVKDLEEFLNRIRKGARVSNEEILSFAMLFHDELTLDKMSRTRLVSMCKYMGMSPNGPDAYLRYMLHNRLRRIKDDDKSIQAEGVESLSEDDLREVCGNRGILGLDSEEKMRQELRNWLDLSLNHSVSSALLILSRAFTVPGNLRSKETIRATLSSLPDDIVTIEEEIEEARTSSEDDVALNEMSVPVTTKRMWEKQEQLCELSRALAVLASSSSVSVECEEFLRLVHKEIQIYNEMVLNGGLVDDPRASMASREECEKDNEAAEVSSALLERFQVDSMLQDLEKELDDVDSKIGNSRQLLDKDFDGKVTAEEVTSATQYLKNTLIENEGITLQDLITTLSKDQEGKILVEDIIKMVHGMDIQTLPRISAFNYETILPQAMKPWLFC